MIEHIKLKAYKGIKEVRLDGLKHINVICGRNSSGKSSLLEAMAQQDKYAVGGRINANMLLKEIHAARPHFIDNIKIELGYWITPFVHSYTIERPISYSDESASFNSAAVSSINNNPRLNHYGSNTFSFSPIYSEYFKGFGSKYKPILIPPKRILHTKTEVSPGEKLEPNGQGCVNYLFFLKNQDRKSEQFITYNRIYDVFRSITGNAFNITLGADRYLQLQFEVSGQWLNADDCGLGLRDLLIIITFVLATDYNMYLIEEPESHLHADFQKKLISKLLKPAKTKQFVLSTHAPIFLEPTTADKVYFCQFNGGEVKVSDEATLSKITNMLGHPVTEVLTSDALIFVEGPTDVPVYQAMLNWWGAMDKYNIRMWPLGGDIMGGLDMKIFGGRKNVFAIIDKDDKSKIARERFKQACEEADIPVMQLERYAAENYFTLDALRKVFGDSIPDTVTKLTPARPIDQQVGLKDKSIKARNAEIVAHMQLRDIEATDLEKGLKTIVEQIEAVQAVAEQAT